MLMLSIPIDGLHVGGRAMTKTNKQKSIKKTTLHVAKKRNKITTVFCKTKVITRGIKSVLFGWKNLSYKQKS